VNADLREIALQSLRAAHEDHISGGVDASRHCSTCEAAVVAILPAVFPAHQAQVRHDALCWRQPDDGRQVACDRANGHVGGHSWELSDVFDAAQAWRVHRDSFMHSDAAEAYLAVTADTVIRRLAGRGFTG
jgi:hypothetical protein